MRPKMVTYSYLGDRLEILDTIATVSLRLHFRFHEWAFFTCCVVLHGYCTRQTNV